MRQRTDWVEDMRLEWIAQGRQAERAEIVAMYRARAKRLRAKEKTCSTLGAQWEAARRAELWEAEADSIERGEHVTEPSP